MADENTSSSSEIEVDDAAAYFGATESSDVLHAMMAMPRDTAMVQFLKFSPTSSCDPAILILKPPASVCSAKVVRSTTCRWASRPHEHARPAPPSPRYARFKR